MSMSTNVWAGLNFPSAGNVPAGCTEEEPLIHNVLQQECSPLCDARKTTQENIQLTLCNNIYRYQNVSSYLGPSCYYIYKWRKIQFVCAFEYFWLLLTEDASKVSEMKDFVELCYCLYQVSGKLRSSDCFGWGSGGFQGGNAQEQREGRPHLTQGVLFPGIAKRKQRRNSQCLVWVSDEGGQTLRLIQIPTASALLLVNVFNSGMT